MTVDFQKNVLKLLTSISIAQLIPVIITPLLTQYFTPEQFGFYGFYISICTIFGAVVSGKYDIAIMLPKSKKDALNILALCFLIAFIFSIIIFSLLNIFHEILFLHINSKLLTKYYIIIPLSVFLISINQSLISLLNRNKKYNNIANQNILKSASNSLSALGFGIKKISSGLISGYIISLIIISVWNIKCCLQHVDIKSINQHSMMKNFKKYIDFFKFSTLSTLFNSFSNIGMTTIIIIFFGAKIAGLYFLAEKLIAIPISFITSSISQVYFQKASKLFYSDKIALLNLTNKIQKNIFYILFPFLLIVSLFGENIFLLLGERWAQAGLIIKYFSVFILMKNIYSPISHIGDILQKQKFLLGFNISLFLFQLLSFYFLKEYTDIKAALLTASFFGAIHYLILNVYMKKELKKLI